MKNFLICLNLNNNNFGTDNSFLNSTEHVGITEIERIIGLGKNYGKGPLSNFINSFHQESIKSESYKYILLNHNTQDENLNLPEAFEEYIDKKNILPHGDLHDLYQSLANRIEQELTKDNVDKDQCHFLVVGSHTEKEILSTALFLKNVLGYPKIAICSHLVASSMLEASHSTIGHQLPGLGIKVFLNLGDAYDYLNIADHLSDKDEFTPCKISPAEVTKELDKYQKRIIELLCFRWSETKLRPLAGGFSGSALFIAHGKKGVSETEPIVIKIDGHAQMRKELDGYYRVKDFLGKHVPSFGLPLTLASYIGVAMELAAMDGRPETLEDTFKISNGEVDHEAFKVRFKKSLSVLKDRLYSNTLRKTKISPYRFFQLHTKLQQKFIRDNSKIILNFCETDGVPKELQFDVESIEQMLKVVTGNGREILTESSLVHGDLNYANIICDQKDNVWFIDWTHAKEAPIETDFAKLEADVKFVISDEFNNSDLKNLREFENYLTSTPTPAKVNDLPEHLTFVKWDFRFKRILETVRDIREKYFNLKQSTSWLVYRIALLKNACFTTSFNKRLGMGQCDLPQLMMAFYSIESLLFELITDDFHLTVRKERPSCYPKRLTLTLDEAPWEIENTNYNPPYFVHETVLQNNQNWADPEDFSKVKRDFKNLNIKYFSNEGKPLNPTGRSGITGRGLLGKWGPNYAVTCFLLRENDNEQIEILLCKKSSLNLIAPQGFIKASETVEQAGKRVIKDDIFIEIKNTAIKNINYGYSYDVRQTDNAWVEMSSLLYLNPNDLQNQITEFNSEYQSVSWEPLNASTVNRMEQEQAKKLIDMLDATSQNGIIKQHNLKLLRESIG